MYTCVESQHADDEGLPSAKLLCTEISERYPVRLSVIDPKLTA